MNNLFCSSRDRDFCLSEKLKRLQNLRWQCLKAFVFYRFSFFIEENCSLPEVFAWRSSSNQSRIFRYFHKFLYIYLRKNFFFYHFLHDWIRMRRGKERSFSTSKQIAACSIRSNVRLKLPKLREARRTNPREMGNMPYEQKLQSLRNERRWPLKK